LGRGETPSLIPERKSEMPKYYRILDNGVEKPMAMSKSKKTGPGKANFKPGGSYSSGRAIPLGIPGAKKKVKGKAVAGKAQQMRKADKADASKRRISGTTRGGRSKY
jgi:hypothetical protein